MVRPVCGLKLLEVYRMFCKMFCPLRRHTAFAYSSFWMKASIHFRNELGSSTLPGAGFPRFHGQ